LQRTQQIRKASRRSIDAVHSLIGRGAGRPTFLADASRGEIDELLKLVMRRHLVTLAALLVQANPSAPAGGVVILDRIATTAPIRAKL
jgi:hypothetical protein